MTTFNKATLKKRKIKHYVRLYGQPKDVTCWAAATTMLLGSQINMAAGPAQARANDGVSAYDRNIEVFANYHGLNLRYPQIWTAEALTKMIEKGPIATLGLLPSSRSYVISGIETIDGTAKTTMLEIFDPFPPLTGQTYKIKYEDWTQRFTPANLYIVQKA